MTYVIMRNVYNPVYITWRHGPEGICSAAEYWETRHKFYFDESKNEPYRPNEWYGIHLLWQ